jgi:hypothetical protein
MTGLSKNNNFIEKSRNKYGDKFDYIDIYISLNDAIKIKCKIHNIIFEVLPRTHLASTTGSCPDCKTNYNKKVKKVDDSHFINKSKNLFGDKFNYSKVDYSNKKGKIILICKAHNLEFTIEPKNHYYSKYGGCLKCNKENIIKNENNITKKEKNKCNDCNIIDKNLFNGICKKCLKHRKQKILGIGKIIENTIIMRSNFNPDEYIKKINITGLENYYASNYGKIFNDNKKLISGHTNQKGYIEVRLLCNGENKLFRAHRLICSTFNGIQKDNKINVDHINKIRNDNRAINLRWVTQKENMNNKSEINITDQKQKILDNYKKLNKNDEEFKIINNSIYGSFPNYAISNYGRVKSLTKNKILQPQLTDEGYFVGRFYSELIQKSIPIHRLVCELFNGKPNNTLLVVNHINENKHDNYYKNLEWTTIKKNNQHSKNIKVQMLNDKKNIIKMFNSFQEAYTFLNKKYTNNIQQQIKRDNKAYGYYWKVRLR